MKKISYLFKRFLGMNFKEFFKTISLVHKKAKKSRVVVFFDMIICSFKYGAGYNDYYSFGMYDMNKEQRNTILTRGKNNKYVANLNLKSNWHYFDNKNEFNEMFNKYLKRKWLYVTDYKSFDKFISKLEKVIAKPNNDSGGKGIVILNKKDFNSTLDMYNYLIENKLLLIEEIIKQHDSLNKLYSGSVNTLRIITVYKDKPYLITSFLRIGSQGYVDNSCSGGMLSMVNKGGVVKYPATDLDLNVYFNHPISKLKIVGFKVPYFKETLDLCFEMQNKAHELNLNYIAWDIAITNSGPVVVEGNPYPGYYYQFPLFCENKTGILPVFNDIFDIKF